MLEMSSLSLSTLLVELRTSSKGLKHAGEPTHQTCPMFRTSLADGKSTTMVSGAGYTVQTTYKMQDVELVRAAAVPTHTH